MYHSGPVTPGKLSTEPRSTEVPQEVYARVVKNQQ